MKSLYKENKYFSLTLFILILVAFGKSDNVHLTKNIELFKEEVKFIIIIGKKYK